jgi:nucleotide sugar dehydrogenase
MSTSMDHFSQQSLPTSQNSLNGCYTQVSSTSSSSSSSSSDQFLGSLDSSLEGSPTLFDFEHAQKIWSSITSSLPTNTPPPEDIRETYFNSAGNQSLLPVVEDETPLVAVIGVGYVGIQLVTSFAQYYNVIAFDVSEKRIKAIAPMMQQYPSVTCSTSPRHLAGVTHFLISVPTTLLTDKQIDTSFLHSAIYTVGLHARPGATVVVESSVAVGMTRQLLSQLMMIRGLKAGMSPEVSSSPGNLNISNLSQRVDPGRVEPVMQAIPKIISGLDDITPGSLASIKKLYSQVFHRIITVSTPEVAEMTKLYENCQRMVCIAYANEMADACSTLGIDPFEVCSAAATKPFGYIPYTPGVGVGGHCIPINPYYLLSNSEFPLLQAATEKMWSRPARLGDSVMDRVLNPSNRSRDFSKLLPRVLVVGVGFKRGQSDLSYSPAVALMQHLLDIRKVHVTFADPLVDGDMIPYIPKLDETREWNKQALEEKFDLVIVALKQTGLDFAVLDELEGVQVVKYCA